MPEMPPPPRGLHFFPAGMPGSRRRPRLLFAAVFLLCSAAMIWPVYPLFSGATPLLLGLPLSLAWLVGWLGIQFVALIALYRSDAA
ncbi:MAG: hypothetical protein R2834_06895 [Rhodothermales bacterium]